MLLLLIFVCTKFKVFVMQAESEEDEDGEELFEKA